MTEISQVELQAEKAFSLVRVRRSPAHFIGIGGVGMAALAHLLQQQGIEVSGCDREESKFTRWLQEKGVRVQLGHDPEHIVGVEWVVRTGAVADDHPEVKRAAAAGLPVLLRGIVVGGLTRLLRSVAITGSHGKTTTTSMLFQILRAAGVKCSYLGGGWDRAARGPAAVGSDSLLVVEADESDGTLASYCPAIGVLTNMEFDHVSSYGSRTVMEEVLQRFAAGCRERFVYALEDGVAARLAPKSAQPLSFGLVREADVAGDLITEFPRCELDCFHHGVRLGRLQLSVGGAHNARNALAAVAAAICLGVEFSAIQEALASFVPVARRLDNWATPAGVEVFSDYAHHPTEIEQVIRQIRARSRGRLWIIFQPHRYSRTRELKEDFVRVLSQADRVVLTPVFSASEPVLKGGRSQDLAEAGRRSGVRFELCDSPEQAWEYVSAQITPGDVLLVLGAGDIERIIERVLRDLGKQKRLSESAL